MEPEVDAGAVALPQPGGIALPPLVREPQPLTPEEVERRRLRAIRWGPPRADLDRRTLVLTLVVLACALAAAVGVFGMALTTDRYLLVLLAPALVLRRGKIYLRDFGIFAALVLLYSEMRGVAHMHPAGARSTRRSSTSTSGSSPATCRRWRCRSGGGRGRCSGTTTC